MKKISVYYLFIVGLMLLGCKENGSENKEEQTRDSLYVNIVNYQIFDTASFHKNKNTPSIELLCKSNLPLGVKIIVMRSAGYETVTQKTFQLVDTIMLTHPEFKISACASMIYGHVLFLVDEKLISKELSENIKNELKIKPLTKNHFYDCNYLFCSYWNIYPKVDLDQGEGKNRGNIIWIDTK